MKLIKISNGQPFEVIERDLSYPFTDTNEAEVGKPMSPSQGNNICLRSSKEVRFLLIKLNMPYGYSAVTISALSPVSYVEKDFYITHYVQITEIDGKRYVVDDPQTNFIGPKDLLNNENQEEIEEWRKIGPPHIDQKLYRFYQEYDFSMKDLFFGGNCFFYPTNETITISPFFENVKEENGFIYGEIDGSEARWSKETGLEWKTETLDQSKDLMFLKESFNPKLILATVRNLQYEYGTDEDTARYNMSSIMSMPMVYPDTKEYIESKISYLRDRIDDIKYYNSNYDQKNDPKKIEEIKKQIEFLEKKHKNAKSQNLPSILFSLREKWEGD